LSAFARFRIEVNVVVVGTNDAGIVCAIQRLEKLQGGWWLWPAAT
jgi:adenine deaminase